MSIIEITPSFERPELARLLGGKKSCNFSRSTQTKIEKLETVCKELMKPSLYFQHREIGSVDKGTVQIKGGTTFKSPKLSKTVEKCGEIVCFIATIGNCVETEIKELMRKNHLSEAYILDAMCSLAVENMAETFHRRMRTTYKKEGKTVTLRFSPGYCDWPVTDQKKLFKIFGSIRLDVELTDSCFMRPRKSISGVFGAMPADNGDRDYPYNPCTRCEKRDCTARRTQEISS